MRAELERTIASYFQREHCLLVGSGTTAIYAILKALDLPDDARVLYPDITCETALNATTYAGLTPVFGDIDPLTFNLDVSRVAKDVDQQAVRVVLATHLFGTILDVGALRRALGDRDVFILEDAAQGYGGWLGDSPVGSFGDAAIISFGAGKLLDCGGGGAVLTDRADLAEQCRAVCETLENDESKRATAKDEYLKALFALTKECGNDAGFASRRDLLKKQHRAAYLCGDLPPATLQRISERFSRIETVAVKRRQRFERLWEALADCPTVVLPHQIGTPAPWRFTFALEHDRDAMFDALTSRSVLASRYFAPLHREFGLPDSNFPHATRLFDGVINIDLNVDEDQQQRHIAGLRELFASTTV